MHITLFFSGALLCNSIPHLAAGLRGEIFPTPFAKPRGKGPSSPLVNFLWGAVNLAGGLFLLASHPVQVSPNADLATIAVGALTIGAYLAIHFGKARAAGTWNAGPAKSAPSEAAV
ncbi:hypothetical protein [Sphingomonas desiccabilis]|uniref:Uncharacterized protein n=1 Tax=Sphingomonas desiccabilis TaxID=429134 RepID=A0A4Q2IXK4_9SPHN|nr:hypothetical protein [Sphingomonas desiccabilis]MBB3910915.1 hypothetical protein [Sphingomonas desiccabilis]RXZ35509.1 hypothetical protein EO081_07820 [Sphingomonas desiccabilis]